MQSVDGSFINKLKKANRVVVVEPHSDDAWLGLGGYMLLNKDKKFLIVTVAISKKNVFSKSRLLSKFVNSENICLCYQNIEREDFERLKTNKIEDVWRVKNKIDFKEVEKKIKKFTGGDVLLLPQGYRDALHNLVSRIDGDGYYREIPYYWNRKEWVGVEYKYNDYDENSLVFELGETADIKWRIFDTIYRDQLGMFQFFRPYYKSIKDEIIFLKKYV